MSCELWTEIMTTGWKWDHVECTEGLPEDAKRMGIYQEQRYVEQDGILVARPDLVLLFESDAWNDGDPGYRFKLPNGEMVLEFTPVFRQYYDAPTTLTYGDRGIKRRVRVQGVGNARMSLDFKPEHATILRDDWAGEKPLEYSDFEELT